MSNTKVSQLPPTLGIKDPETRQFLDALTNAWEMRSGNTNKASPERFLTAGELTSELDLFASASSGSAGGSETTRRTRPSGSIAEAIGGLEDGIRRGILYQLLTTELDLVSLKPIRDRIDQIFSNLQGIDNGFINIRTSQKTDKEAFTREINAAISRIGDAEAAIVTEAETRATHDFALTNQISIASSRIGNVESAIVNEANTRSTKDSALASAINTIWASIGGNEAVIQDGQLAAVTPSAVSASKWNQLQSAAIDPNTGQASSAIVRQELSTYASLVDDKLNAIYSVRAQTSRNGRTVVGGFGLAAVGGANSAEGPNISFGVTADRFFIAPPASSSDYSDATLIGSGAPTEFPFIALSTPQTIGNVTYQPGVYIRNANIANASIDTAKIRDLAVDTIKISNGAVTTMHYAAGAAGTVPAGGEAFIAAVAVTMPSGSSGVAIIANCNMYGVSSDGTAGIEIRKNNARLAHMGVSFVNGYGSTFTMTAFDPYPTVGTGVYSLHFYNPTTGPGSMRAFVFSNTALLLTGGKR